MAVDPGVGLPAFVSAGRYRLGELIGRGGMGEVHAAWDLRLERPVAIKTLRDDVAAQQSVRRRFEAEARSAARLVHPNVVAVYDSGEDDGIPYMVMELLPGRSLRDEISAGPMPVSEVRSLASQVLGALAVAHSAGIVHRDIKPANILMTEDGRWKVSDFGIAKSIQMQDADETVTGMVLGTPAYLAPERLFGGEATPAGDVYSLGVILYEALAGRRPFHADSPEGWAAVVAAQAPEPLASFRQDVPPAIVVAIEKSISRDPAARFTSAGEMADALGSRREAAQVAGAATGAAIAPGAASWREVAPAGTEETALLAAGTQGATDVLPTTGRKDRRRRGLAVLVGGAVVAAIAGVSVAAAGIGGESPASKTQLPPTTPATMPTTVPQTAPPATAPPATAPAAASGPAKHNHDGGGGGPGKGGNAGGHGGHGGRGGHGGGGG